MFKLRITGDLGFEVWHDIPGYEGKYQASTYGRVKSKERYRKGKSGSKVFVPQKMLSIKRNLRYDFVCLNVGKHGERKTISLHRLVASTFIPNFHNLPYINHKDENPKNNRAENLEWCSPKYNRNYGTCEQKRLLSYMNNETLGKHKHKTKPIKGINLLNGKIVLFKSIADAARFIGSEKCSPNIIAALKGKMTQSYNYKWEYL